MAVFVIKEQKNIRKSISEIFNKFEKVIDYTKGFFIKPNIVFPVLPGSGEITRPDVVRAVIEVLRERYGKVDIVIGEGTAAGTIPIDNFKISGFLNLAKELKVELIDLNEVERISMKWKYGLIEFPKIVFERVYINLPILKLSAAAIISGALKNQKGLLSPDMKKKFHKLGLHDPIAQLAKVIQPDLTIMDGFNFFKRENIFIAGDNAYETDGLAIKLLNIDEPEYFKIARENEIGSDDFLLKEHNSLQLNSNKYKVEKYKEYFNIRLWSNPRACSMCRLTLYDIKKCPMKDIKYSLQMYLKLSKYILKGVDFIFGSKPEFEANSKNVICIGDCTKRLAQKKGYKHIPGCPPTKEEMIKCI